MRLQQYLIEKLDLNKKLDIIKKSKNWFEAEFETGEEQFNFIASYGPAMTTTVDQYTWDIEFNSMTQSSSEITGTMGIKSLEVFSYIASALKQFISSYNPESFLFTAKEPSRVKLYNKLSKMVSQKTGYKLKTMKDKYAGETVYFFTKK